MPPKTCDYLCRSVVECAKNGCLYPLSPLDAYGDLWLAVESAARRLPPLGQASRETYLRAVIDNQMSRYLQCEVVPLREEYRLVEQRLVESGDASATSRDLAENLPSRPDAAKRRDEAIAFLSELIPLLPDEIARAFLAYLAAEGNFLEAANIARIGKSRFYSSWAGWLRTARSIAEKIG